MPAHAIRMFISLKRRGAVLCFAVLAFSAGVSAAGAEGTRVVVLGTGTPVMDVDRAGPAIAVVTGGKAYLFDAGAGSVRRLHEAAQKFQMPALNPPDICCVFFTHLHSDHTEDYPELVSTIWWARKQPLQAFGPTGLARFTEAMRQMQDVDARLRLASNQPIANPGFPKVVAIEIGPGKVFENDDIRIAAFAVKHGDIKPAFGYRIDTADRSIVISGDTAYSQTLVEKAKGVDLLFHEVASRKGLNALPPAWQTYHSESHATADVVVNVAQQARPGKLVLYHILFFGVSANALRDEVRAGYDGVVIVASDLDLF